MRKLKGVIIVAMFIVSLIAINSMGAESRTKRSEDEPAIAIALTSTPFGQLPYYPMPYYEDFESGAIGWYVDGWPWPLWHLVGPGDTYQDYHSASHSFWYGQDATGDYDTWTWEPVPNDGILISPPVYLSTDAVLKFWTSWEIEGDVPSYYDRMEVWVYDGISTSMVLQLNPTWDPGDEFGYYSSAGYNTPRIWVQRTVSLSAYTGKIIEVIFYFYTGDEILNDYRGWYVDDVAIERAPPTVTVNPIAAFMPVKNYHLRQV